MKKAIKDFMNNNITYIRTTAGEQNIMDKACSYFCGYPKLQNDLLAIKWYPGTGKTDDYVFLQLLMKWSELNNMNVPDFVCPKPLLETVVGADYDSIIITEFIWEDAISFIGNSLIQQHNEQEYQKDKKSLSCLRLIRLSSKGHPSYYFGRTRRFSFLGIDQAFATPEQTHYNSINEIFSEPSCSVVNIRKRPGMYIGGTNNTRLHSMLIELIAELINLPGASQLQIELESENQVTITGYQRAFGEDKYLFLKAVCAFSSTFIWKEDGYTAEYHKGVLAGESDETWIPGSFQLTFQPDRAIFSDYTLKYPLILASCIELACLNSGITLIVTDGSNYNKLFFQKGLKHLLVTSIDYHSSFYHSWDHPISFGFEEEGLILECALNLSVFPAQLQRSYVNGHRTFEGTHIQAFHRGIRKALWQFAVAFSNMKKPDPNWIHEMDYVLSIHIPEPRYYEPTRRKLDNIEIKKPITSKVSELLYQELAAAPEQFLNPNGIF